MDDVARFASALSLYEEEKGITPQKKEKVLGIFTDAYSPKQNLDTAIESVAEELGITPGEFRGYLDRV